MPGYNYSETPVIPITNPSPADTALWERITEYAALEPSTVGGEVRFQPSERVFEPELQCYNCERRFPFGEESYRNGPIVLCGGAGCCSAWGYCNRCDRRTSYGNAGELNTESARWTCQRCLTRCHSCGDYVEETDIQYSRDRGYCPTCYDEAITILYHNTNPLDYVTYQGTPKDGIFYGVELEVEVGTDSFNNERLDLARKVNEALKGFAIVKHDGSLENGFEIVTAPATFELQEEYWDKFLKLDLPLISWDSTRCGMHVHFSRAPIKPTHLARIMVFGYSPSNRNMVETIAGRSLTNSWGQRYAEINSQWKITNFAGVIDQDNNWMGMGYRNEVYTDERGRLRSRTIINPPEMVSLKRNNKLIFPKRPNGNRYTAINDTNDNTVEMRIFRGTTNFNAFMKNLEFVKATIDFCRPGQFSFKELENVNVFTQYVDQNGKDYPRLKKFLSKFGYIKGNGRVPA
jgi:hypothetical protein